jgi:hypothetical protein
MELTLDDLLIRNYISQRAREKWDLENEEEKVEKGIKYAHLFSKNNNVLDWKVDYEELSKGQQTVLMQGEIIRTYNLLSFTEKKKLQNKLKLSRSPNKWFNLPSVDKQKILKEVLREKNE